jgi:hypothetical protein
MVGLFFKEPTLPIRLSPTATRDSIRPSSWTFTSVTDPGAVQPRCARRQDDLRNGTTPLPPDNGQTSEPSPGRSPHRPTQSFTQEPGGTLHVGGVGKIRIGKEPTPPTHTGWDWPDRCPRAPSEQSSVSCALRRIARMRCAMRQGAQRRPLPDAKIGDVEVSWRSPGVAARGTLDARDLNDEAATPADSIDAAHCNDREFGTSRGQLATESYPDLRVLCHE